MATHTMAGLWFFSYRYPVVVPQAPRFPSLWGMSSSSCALGKRQTGPSSRRAHDAFRDELLRVVLHATWTEAGAGGGTKLGLSAGSAGCGVIDENVDCGDGGARLDAREKVCWVWPGMAASNEIHEIQGCLRRPQLRTAAAPLAPVAASHRHLTPEQVRKFTLRVCPHTTQLECVRVNLPAAALWSLGWWACEQARVQPGRPAHGSYSTRRTRRMTTPAP